MSHLKNDPQVAPPPPPRPSVLLLSCLPALASLADLSIIPLKEQDTPLQGLLFHLECSPLAHSPTSFKSSLGFTASVRPSLLTPSTASPPFLLFSSP